jgi:hypothetical protein
MGLHEQTESTANFLVIKDHSLCLESKTPVEGWEEVHRQNPQDKKPDGSFGTVTKWIKRFASVDGKITRIEFYDRDSAYGRFIGLKIHLKDNGETFQIDLPFGTRHYDAFTKMAENIDYAAPVEFLVWHNKKEDTTAFAIRQFGKFIQWKYTRGNMGDCPEPVQNKLGKWNFDDQQAWLLDRIQTVVIPHVEELNGFNEPMPDYTDEPTSFKALDAAVGGKHDPQAPIKTKPDLSDIPF